MEMVEALALVSERVEKEILLRNEYLAAENEILKSGYQTNPVTSAVACDERLC